MVYCHFKQKVVRNSRPFAILIFLINYTFYSFLPFKPLISLTFPDNQCIIYTLVYF